jgi:hypothetical protein
VSFGPTVSFGPIASPGPIASASLILGVDLAAKNSAYSLLGTSGKVITSGDSFQIPEQTFVKTITDQFCYTTESSPAPNYLLIEDLPHGLRFGSTVKDVCRLQGRILHELDGVLSFDFIYFIPPALWQRWFPGVYKGGKRGAAKAALELGYVPPDLIGAHTRALQSVSGKERSALRTVLHKVETDYVDAFLLAWWGHLMLDRYGTIWVPSAQQWDPERRSFQSRSKEEFERSFNTKWMGHG